MNEIFKPIKGYRNYEVSNVGRVKNKKTGRILKSADDGHGYKHVILCKNNKTKCFKIHRLVAKAFIPNPNNLPQINHRNGIKTDNLVSNLEWTTAKENTIHAYKTGLNNNCGENHHSNKLTKIQVEEIRKKYRPWKYSQCKLAKEYGVSQMNISFIVRNERWKD